MKNLLRSVTLSMAFAAAAVARAPTPTLQTGQAGATPAAPAGSVSLQEYREILNNERKLLEEQSERYYARIDALTNRVIWGLGLVAAAALAVLGWGFGKTRQELQAFVREQFQGQVSSLIDTDMSDLKETVRDLKSQVRDLRAFQDRSVVWVFSGEEVRSQRELEALHATGLQNIQTVAPRRAEELALGEPDLVIFSYDGSEEGRRRLDRIVAVLNQQSPPVSLLIYTYNPEGAEVRLGEPERGILKDFLWYMPVNFPTTLVAQAQLLVRAGREL
jgi:hypothetical protein